VRELPNAGEMPKVTGRVEFRHVTFGYDPAEPVLKDLDLLALPGEKIALVGTSGQVKRLWSICCPGFTIPQQGQVLIDGVDIATVTLRSLRRQIGIVPQEMTLFSGTIAQNIAFGQKEFDSQAVEQLPGSPMPTTSSASFPRVITPGWANGGSTCPVVSGSALPLRGRCCSIPAF
jgi:ATP-binding cassette subfamily B protein